MCTQKSKAISAGTEHVKECRLYLQKCIVCTVKEESEGQDPIHTNWSVLLHFSDLKFDA